MQAYSKRTDWRFGLTPLALACAERKRLGAEVLDMTCANPTLQGFTYSPAELAAFRGSAQYYAPSALGLSSARSAAAADFCRQGGQIGASGVWIAAGTSELYAHTMAILCDPGSCWLVPQPGYPLFDYVADIMGVRLQHYPLVWDDMWYLDAERLEAAASRAQARALVVISPHNPTGHVWTLVERQMIVDCCRRHNMALVVDEVFLDYPLAGDLAAASCAGCEDVLTICMSGASKVAAFPQGKIAWAAVSGPGSEEYLVRAELVSDTFLSVSTVMQGGLDSLLAAAPAMRARLRQRCQTNLSVVRALLEDTPISVCPAQAGWSMLLRLPQTLDDADWAMQALVQQAVLTHPGYLFGMEQVHASPFLGISLLLDEGVFAEGVRRLAMLVEGNS